VSQPIDEYTEAAVQRLLTEHPHIAEQGIELRRRENVLVLSGEVESAGRRDEIERLVVEHFPGVRVRCDIGIVRSQPPVEHEELR
jgi:hypothetical protein